MASSNEDPLVVLRQGTDFRVYDPRIPSVGFTVGIGSGKPICTCTEFAKNAPQGMCAHIKAVERTIPTYLKKDTQLLTAPHPSPASAPEPHPGAKLSVDGARYLTLKRSVSPDGRIDSLSVEVTSPIDDFLGTHAARIAKESLTLQIGIVEAFLGRNGNGKGKEDAALSAPPDPRPVPDQAAAPPEPVPGSGTNEIVPATIVGVGSWKTAYGWSLYLNFQVKGQSIWYFGTRGKLTDALKDAGYGADSALVKDGQKLDLPCKVVLVKDGRYSKVSRVLPAESH